MENKINKNKWLFKQFTLINRTAIFVYNAMQGGVDMNFYQCYIEYQDGVFGWVKEDRAFETAVEIYDQYTGNDGWDIINQLEDEFDGDLAKVEYSLIQKYEREFAELEL